MDDTVPHHAAHDAPSKCPPTEENRSPLPSATRINWPLAVGGILVLIILLVAIAGPSLALQDPVQEHTIIKVGDGWELPPFRPFSVPGFPLGSDVFGRDLLSRLLWGVRPTLVMVIAVAITRLVLGIAIGLGAGWFSGRVGHSLETAIGAALSIPVLMVALGAIAIVGVELGLLAFIIGLSINGWAETASLVRDQTQRIKGNLYIEAARALGAADSHILLRHVVRQILPMTWMLFAFEVGGTLMTTAGLGFLGYYIGGDVWVAVDDFVARRLSGMPELGQMLASAWNEQQVITEPWAILVAGSAIFIAVLGFNLLGEGLRMQLSLQMQGRRSLVAVVREQATEWASKQGWLPQTQRGQTGVLQRLRRSHVLVVVVIILFVGAGIAWWRLRPGDELHSADNLTQMAQFSGHVWVTARHDPQGTLWSSVPRLATPDILWSLQVPHGLAGGPAISAEGTIYLASTAGILYAVGSDGQILWQASLSAGAVGTPALGTDGTIYVAAEDGTLAAVAADGDPIWQFQSESGSKATTGPVAAPGGPIFFPGGGRMYAVSPQGELMWTARIPYGFNPFPPQLSPTGELVFFLDSGFYSDSGAPFNLEQLEGKAANEQYIMGADGLTYYRSAGQIIQWTMEPAGAQPVQYLTKQIPGHPRDTGVTPDGIVWATYTVGYNNPNTGILWVDQNDVVLGNIEYQQMPTRVIGVGQQAIVYTCGNTLDGTVQCSAAQPGKSELLWQITIDQESTVVGGAITEGRLYCALENGLLYAIGAADPTDADVNPTTHSIGATGSAFYPRTEAHSSNAGS